MKKEFNLSERRYNKVKIEHEFYIEEDIKKFIRLLKEHIIRNIEGSEKFYNDNPENLLNFIDKLAGDKLK